MQYCNTNTTYEYRTPHTNDNSDQLGGRQRREPLCGTNCIRQAQLARGAAHIHTRHAGHRSYGPARPTDQCPGAAPSSCWRRSPGPCPPRPARPCRQLRLRSSIRRWLEPQRPRPAPGCGSLAPHTWRDACGATPRRLLLGSGSLHPKLLLLLPPRAPRAAPCGPTAQFPWRSLSVGIAAGLMTVVEPPTAGCTAVAEPAVRCHLRLRRCRRTDHARAISAAAARRCLTPLAPLARSRRLAPRHRRRPA